MYNTEYVSRNLCHFVGRTQSSDEARYDLLLKILKQDKALFANIDNPDHPTLRFLFNRTSKLEKGEIFDQRDCVCFCDIPNDSLGIHINKYSPFGIGFKKEFLINCGARPVTYIPENCEIQEVIENTATPKAPNDYFYTLVKQASGVLNLLMMLDQQKSFKDQLNEILSIANSDVLSAINEFVIGLIGEDYKEKPVRNFLVYLYSAWITQCSFIKPFDSSLSEDDPKNYYMEREWRCPTNVQFSLQDIDTIYLPSNDYKTRFQMDVPEYNGAFFIFE